MVAQSDWCLLGPIFELTGRTLNGRTRGRAGAHRDRARHAIVAYDPAVRRQPLSSDVAPVNRTLIETDVCRCTVR